MKKNLWIALLAVLQLSTVLANDLQLAPPNFDITTSKSSAKFNFVDFQRAHYKITYDVKTKKAFVETLIQFIMTSSGHPLFDLTGNDQATAVLGEEGQVSVKIIDVANPYFKTAYRSIDRALPAGNYILKITSQIENLITFNSQGVRSSFWMSDLNNRRFLERFIPSNLEYDHYQMTFDIQVIGDSQPYQLVTNCEQKLVSENHYLATCPKFFNTASLFYHLFPKSAHTIITGQYQSISGKMIPVYIYGSSVQTAMKNSFKILKELEADYGPWPHPQLIVYLSGMGGMEYSGATMTSMSALGHELHHSYFARAIHPANGNAGWIDEAMASWRDENYEQRSSYRSPTKMAGHSVYRRHTDDLAYTRGEDIIAYFDYKFKDQGGMKSFMREWVKNILYKPMTTSLFQSQLESFFGVNLKDFFDTYIYGKSSLVPTASIIKSYQESQLESRVKRDRYHPQLSEAQLKSFL